MFECLFASDIVCIAAKKKYTLFVRDMKKDETAIKHVI